MKNIINNNFLTNFSQNKLIDFFTSNILDLSNISLVCFDETINENSPIINLLNNNLNLFVIGNQTLNIKHHNLHKFSKELPKQISILQNTNVLIYIHPSSYFSTEFAKTVIQNIINLYNNPKINIGIPLEEEKNLICNIDFQFEDDFLYNQIISSFVLLYQKDLKSRYEYIYDFICNYLDAEFQKHDYCKFKYGTCIVNREHRLSFATMGCCYSFDKPKYLMGFITNLKQCKYLGSNGCTTKCIACKFYFCKYLRDQGIQFLTSEVPLLTCFFTKKQIEIIEMTFFTDKDVIINKLLNCKQKI